MQEGIPELEEGRSGLYCFKAENLCRRFFNFWTSLASNLYLRTHYDAQATKSRTLGAVESSVESGFCGQTLPPAADKLWEKLQECDFSHSFAAADRLCFQKCADKLCFQRGG